VTHETLDQIKPVSCSRNNWPFAATQRVALKMDRRLSGNCRIGRVSIQICSLPASGETEFAVIGSHSLHSVFPNLVDNLATSHERDIDVPGRTFRDLDFCRSIT
jgi:hypothetical protein